MIACLIQKDCGCVYDTIIEGYQVLCSYHSFDGLINFGRDERFKTRIVRTTIQEEVPQSK